MTVAYTVTFLGWWSISWVILLVLFPATIVLCILDPSWPVAIAILAQIGYSLYVRTHTPRLRVRAGFAPTGCVGDGDVVPRTVEELEVAVARRRERGTPVRVVGSGWSYWLQRRRAARPAVFTHRLQTPPDAVDGRTWMTGDTVTRIQRDLKRVGRTLSEFPTLEYVTLGGWLTAMCHGHPGERVRENVLLTADVLDVNTGETLTLTERQLCKAFASKRCSADADASDARGFVMTHATLRSVPNILVERQGRLLEDATDAKWWLNSSTYLRLAFAGARGAVGLIWVDPVSDTAHRNPHCCSKFCAWFHLDVLSFASSRFLQDVEKEYLGVETLASANEFVPPVFPIQLGIAMLLDIVNFEVFARHPTSPARMQHVFAELVAFHKAHGGRTEIRLRHPNILMIDWAIRRSRVPQAMACLIERIGIVRFCLHPGKARVDVPPSATLVPPFDILHCRARA